MEAMKAEAAGAAEAEAAGAAGSSRHTCSSFGPANGTTHPQNPRMCCDGTGVCKPQVGVEVGAVAREAGVARVVAAAKGVAAGWRSNPHMNNPWRRLSSSRRH